MFLLAWTSMSTGVWQNKKGLHNSCSTYESTYLRLCSAPDLQELEEEKEFKGLTTHFFPPLDIPPSLSLPVGSKRVTANPLFWLGFSNTQFWPPEELLFSLAHVKALYHLSLSYIFLYSLVPILSCQTCLHRGL